MEITGNIILLVNLGPIVSIFEFGFITSKGKLLE